MLPRLKYPRRGWQLAVAVLVLVGLVLGSFAGFANSASSARSAPAKSTAVPAETTRTTSPAVRSGASTAALSSVASSAPLSTFRLGHVDVPGPHPSVWGPSGMPPGWIVPSTAGSETLPFASAPNSPNDPLVSFYSDLNGSGGNVTWNVTLPVDRNTTNNQSDLYWAAEFTMTVTAPSAYMDECELALELYPDASWTGSDNGNWIGAVVGWQIQQSTGLENPCFYSPLYSNGIPSSTFFNMNQGDRLSVTMTGWPGNPTGELVTIEDLTNGTHSYVTAFNSTGDYPLDPAYSANDVQDALQWGTGGEYPVAFGFITGRGYNPTIPSNNSLGGCSPGPPPSTAANPAVPCPSYDPGSWINDTLHPWLIDTPDFFNATANSGRPAQVTFTQTLGGVDEFTSATSACAGRLGTSYCSYPWFSYSCGASAFEFGATNYPGVSNDFGKFYEYAQSAVENAADIPYYPAVSYSVPTCGGPSYSLTLGSMVTGGTVAFLDHNYSATTTLTGLAPGEYQLAATEGTGEEGNFGSWSASGGAVPTYPDGGWTTLTLTGNGAIYSAPGDGESYDVTFDDAPSGEIAFNLAYPLSLPEELTATNGAVGGLQPGIYALLAFPPKGFEFAGWSSSGAGFSISAPSLPLTSLVVTGSLTEGIVTAQYASSASGDKLGIAAYDPANDSLWGGSVTLGGVLTTNTKAATGLIPVGTYNLTATPDVGYRFGGWYYTPSSIMFNFTKVTNVTLETGTLNKSTPAGLVLAIFIPDLVNATFAVAAGQGGAIIAGVGGVESGGVVQLIPGKNYTLSAVPGIGWKFVSWGPTGSSTVWNRNIGSWTELLVVNATTTVDVTYGTALEENLSFQTSPNDGGEITFNGYNEYGNGTWNSTVAGAESYLIDATPASGYSFLNWSTLGEVTATPASSNESVVTISGSGTLIATFAPTTFAVTILAVPPQPADFEVDGTSVYEGATLLLPAGTHSVSVTGSAPFEGWNSTVGLTVSSPGQSSTTFSVSGPGALTAVLTPFGSATPEVTPSAVDVGVPTDFVSTLPYAGSFTIGWSGLPPGCPVETTLTFHCTPSVAGTYPVSVTFTDAWGASNTSLAVPLVVNPSPSLSEVHLSLSTVDVGVTTLLSATESGGTGPFEWSYSGLPAGCSSLNQTSLSCTPSAAGTFDLTFNVTDRFGELATTTVPLVVNPLPTIVATVSPTNVEIGGLVTFTATVSGGSGPISYDYANLPPGCFSSSVASFSCTPSRVGLYTVNVSSSDEFGKYANQSLTLIVSGNSSQKFDSLPTELAIGLLVLLVIAVVAFVALRRRPKKPTIVATPATAPAPPPHRPATPPAPAPEWSEEAPPPQEWHEGQ